MSLAELPTDLARRAGGRLPPQNIDAEESVLGAMLLSSDAIGAAVERLDAQHFYVPANGLVFDAIETLYISSEPVDCLTVADQLERTGNLAAAGGSERLLALEAATPTLAHVDRYARIVEDNALLRRLISVSAEISELAYDRPTDTAAAIDQAESLVFSVAERRIVDSTESLHDLLDQSLDRLEELYERGDAFSGLATGFSSLDRILSGIQPSSLVVVGGRPAMGKTAFALTMASNVALELQEPVLLFCLEMNHAELTGRLLASDARGRCHPGADRSAASRGVEPHHAQRWPPRRCADVDRRQSQRDGCRDPRQGPAVAQPLGQLGPHRCRLPPAHERPRHGREPSGGDRRDLARFEDPRSRARNADRGAVTAQPEPRVPRRQATDALGPA